MKQSKQTIPHFYLQTSAHAETMVARRQTQGDEPTVLDAFFVHAAGKALRRFERLTFGSRTIGSFRKGSMPSAWRSIWEEIYSPSRSRIPRTRARR